MKQTLISILLFFTASAAFVPGAFAEASYRVDIEDAIDRLNLVIKHPETDELYLIHLRTSCGILKPKQEVTLIISGDLDSSNDTLKISPSQQCKIDLAERFTERLVVEKVYGTQREANVRTENNLLYYVNFSGLCSSIVRHINEEIFVRQDGDQISSGDRLILPDADGICSIQTLRRIPESRPSIPEVNEAIDQNPTTPTKIMAFPRNHRVYLTWNESNDDHRVSHYLVSVSLYRLNPHDLEPESMPNVSKVNGTRFIAEDLENNKMYWFYLAGVDYKGNISEWSRGTVAMPRGLILADSLKIEERSMNPFVVQESDLSFLVRWNDLPSATYYSITLETDGELDFTNHKWSSNHVRVLKWPNRKGKEMILRVRAYDPRGLLREESLTFSFGVGDGLEE
jgi:hypothetical protein